MSLSAVAYAGYYTDPSDGRQYNASCSANTQCVQLNCGPGGTFNPQCLSGQKCTFVGCSTTCGRGADDADAAYDSDNDALSAQLPAGALTGAPRNVFKPYGGPGVL